MDDAMLLLLYSHTRSKPLTRMVATPGGWMASSHQIRDSAAAAVFLLRK